MVGEKWGPRFAASPAWEGSLIVRVFIFPLSLLRLPRLCEAFEQ